MTTQIPRHL